MMLCHLSDVERVAKQLVKEQEKYGYEESWYSEVKKVAMEIGIVISYHYGRKKLKQR